MPRNLASLGVSFFLARPTLHPICGSQSDVAWCVREEAELGPLWSSKLARKTRADAGGAGGAGIRIMAAVKSTNDLTSGDDDLSNGKTILQ